jgi:diguanylate cyclase (GGDEF)-like protein/hemerythrin-like metal-binding protein
METFIWDEHFVTGLTIVDEQHQGLVALINEFGEHLSSDDPVSLEELDRIFIELSNYAQYHFTEEEQFMRQIGIDAAYFNHHHSKHWRFLKELTDMRDLSSGIDFDSSASLLKFLTHWLAYHILGEDQMMAKQIAFINNGMSPSDAYKQVSKMQVGATEPLLNALNGLFEQVSERNQMLVELNRTLEERVQERTQALYDANLTLETQAHTDQLTHLPNRRHAMRFLENAWVESYEEESPLVCIMIDADGFKQVNDQYGHDAGDIVLRELSKCLVNTFRTDDFVARLGGDEFMAILKNTDLAGGKTIAELVRAAVFDMKVYADDELWKGSISVGVAERSSSMESHSELVKAADKAVYQSKNNGKNRVECFAG